jgi:hypothetical protein
MPANPPTSTLARSRREALIILTASALALGWAGVVSYLWGYGRDPATLTYPLGLGIPDWVFWGVVAPWLACNLFTAWLTLGYMQDEQLAAEEADAFAEGGGHAG